jgi:hypothetical protein
LENKNEFKKYIAALSTKAFNISKEISKRGRAIINPDEMKLIAKLSAIGRLLTPNKEFEEIMAVDYFLNKGYSRIANIVGSQVIGQEKIGRFMKKANKQLPFVSSYVIDSLEKKILTFCLLSTTLDGNDIYYIDMLGEMINSEKNEHLLKFLEIKYDQLIKICDEVEDFVNN